MRGLIVVGVVSLLLSQYKSVFLILAAICAAAILGRVALDLRKKKKEEEERLAAQIRAENQRLAAQRRAEELAAEAHRENQRQLYSRSVDIMRLASQNFNAFPKELIYAGNYLNRAEREFIARAFSPFWELIEEALRCLGNVHDIARRIEKAAQNYDETVRQVEGTSPMFSVSTSDVAYLKHKCVITEERLAGIVRKAQTDYQFSTIFEQRRTSSILIAGFKSLGEAIYGLGRELVSSMNSLESRLEGIEQTFREQHRESLLSMASVAEEASLQRTAINAEQAELTTKQIAMLDNIQRGREPLHHERGPRSW